MTWPLIYYHQVDYYLHILKGKCYPNIQSILSVYRNIDNSQFHSEAGLPNMNTQTFLVALATLAFSVYYSSASSLYMCPNEDLAYVFL